MNQENFMRLALEQAKLAKTAGDLPFGAVVVQGDKVVGKGRAENNTVGVVFAPYRQRKTLYSLVNSIVNYGTMLYSQNFDGNAF